MALLLSIETATTTCSVSVHQDNQLLVNQSVYINHSHSSRLAPIINSAIAQAGHQLKDLEGIGLSMGPGSYTGLRIGTSTAKGLCYALDIPLVAINTLEAMALQVIKFFPEEYLFCPMIDARRMEVYSTIVNSDLDIVQETTPTIIDQQTFVEVLDGTPLVFFGNGADKCKGVIKNSNAYFVDGIEPNASTVGELAYGKFVKKEFEDLAYFEPFYLKEFMATKPKQIS